MRNTLSFLALCLGFVATTTYAQPAQDASSIRWIVILRNAQRTEQPGSFALWGPQSALRIEIGITNFRGPRVSSSNDLTAGVAITMRNDDEDLPVTWELAEAAPNALDLAEGDGRSIVLVVKPQTQSGFGTGSYEFTVSLKKLLASLVLADNTPWTGMAKGESSHRILLRPVVTAAERAAFDEQEANARLGLGRAAEAIPFLEELTRLRPDNWYAYASLGNAYLQANQVPQAISAYERSIPGWLGVRSRTADQVAFDLARAYTLAGRGTQATTLLRSHGLSDQEITTRMRSFQRK